MSIYQLTYRSVVPEFGNRPTVASGLVAVPESGARPMPVLPTSPPAISSPRAASTSRAYSSAAGRRRRTPVDIYQIMNRWMSNPQPVDAHLPGVVTLRLSAQAHYLSQDGLAATRRRRCLLYCTIYPVGLSDAALFPELTEFSRGEK